MTGEEAGKDPTVADLPDAFGGATDEFVVLGLVVGQEAACPEGTIGDGSVEYVHGGLREGALGGVGDAKGDGEGQRKVNRFVFDPFPEVEGVCSRYISDGEAGAGAVAGWDLGGGGLDEAGKGTCDVDRGEFRAEEPWVVAPVAHEELVFGPRVRGSECAALRLEDRADVLVWRDHIESREEVVVGQGGDALGGGEATAKVGVERGGIFADAFV